MAKQAGFDERQAAMVDAGFEDSALSERHKLAIRWADAFLTGPDAVPANLLAAVRAAFTPAEVVEMTVGLALYVGFSKMAIALGPPPASMPVIEVPVPAVPGDPSRP